MKFKVGDRVTYYQEDPRFVRKAILIHRNRPSGQFLMWFYNIEREGRSDSGLNGWDLDINTSRVNARNVAISLGAFNGRTSIKAWWVDYIRHLRLDDDEL